MKMSLTIPAHAGVHPTRALDRELRFGPGMRAQRLTEAAFMLAALFTQDVRFAYVTFVLAALQALSPRWALVARGLARLMPFKGEHHIGDLYFDLQGSRGACAISVFVLATGIGLVWGGYATVGFIVLTIPTASFLMAPTLGFCAGCWFYVLGRDWLARHGWLRRGFDDFNDIGIDNQDDRGKPELHAAPQR